MNRLALITGATSGIGKASALLLAKNGFNLILTGRREQRLESLKNEIELSTPAKVITLAFNIRVQEEVNRAIDSLPESWKSIDVLINNAGLAAGYDFFQDADINDWEDMIDTNIKGLLYISRKIVPGMVGRCSGHIVNLSSVAGKETYPMGSVYCASKHAVQSITKGMRLDLLKYGIKVSSISPGAVETEFSLVRFKGDSERAKAVYKGITPLNAEDIAETILFVLTRPPHVNIDDILVMPTDQAFSRDFNRR